MEWCVLFKYIDEKLTGNNCIYIDSGADVFVQYDLVFDNNQCSGLYFAHGKYRFDQFFYCVARELLCVRFAKDEQVAEQALAAVAEGADYIGFGPLFPTGTKPGRPAIGLQDIATVQQQLGDFPMFCIGGVNGSTLPAVLTAGARRVVIVSWLLQQPDVAAATRNVLAQL